MSITLISSASQAGTQACHPFVEYTHLRIKKYKAIIATKYSSGIRLEECVNLDINDIDSSRMVHVRQGKGGKDPTISSSYSYSSAWLHAYPSLWILCKQRSHKTH
jgi:site-specific recombinase XerD